MEKLGPVEHEVLQRPPSCRQGLHFGVDRGGYGIIVFRDSPRAIPEQPFFFRLPV